MLRRLLTDNHEDRRQQLRLARRALRLARSLVTSGHADPARRARRVRPPVRADRRPARRTSRSTSRWPTSRWPRSTCSTRRRRRYTLDVVSVVEAVLEAPRQILFAQQHAARGEAIGEMKADGVEYDERMALLEEVTWPQPLGRAAGAALRDLPADATRWLLADALAARSRCVREMWEQGMGFTDFVGRYQLARSEGLVLRYLTDAYRTLRQTVPERHRTPELDDLVEWLGETIRQTDSSLLDEWEALPDPEHVRPDVAHHEPPPPPRPISQQDRAVHGDDPQRDVRAGSQLLRARRPRRADAARARGRRPARAAARGRHDRSLGWDAALEEYYAEHDSIGTDGDARGPAYLHLGAEDGASRPARPRGRSARIRRVAQTLPTRPTTATGCSRRSSTATPPTRPASWCWRRRRTALRRLIEQSGRCTDLCTRQPALAVHGWTRGSQQISEIPVGSVSRLSWAPRRSNVARNSARCRRVDN